MSTIERTSKKPGTIEPGTLYTLPEAQGRLGLGSHAMRMARRAGLQIIRAHERGYVKGAAIIAYLEKGEA